MFSDRYRKMNEQISPGPALTEQTMKRIIRPRRRTRLVLAIVLGTLLGLLGTTALAARAVTGDWLGFLVKPGFPADLAELVAEPGTQVGCGDYRVTLQSAVGDGTAYYVLGDIDTVSAQPLTADPLQPLASNLPANIQLDMRIDSDSPDFSGGWTAYRIDDQTDPARATLIIRASLHSSGRRPSWIMLDIRRILAVVLDPPAAKQVSLAEGTWSFVISGRSDPQQVTVRTKGMTIKVTPLSLLITARSAPFSEMSPLQLERSDGRLIDLRLIGTGSAYDGFLVTHWHLSALFEEQIDPGQGVALIVAGERIAFPQPNH